MIHLPPPRFQPDNYGFKNTCISKLDTYRKLWTNHFTGAAPGGGEIHHNQLVSSILQDLPELSLQKINKSR